MSTSDAPTGQRSAIPVNLDQDQGQHNQQRPAPLAGQQQYAQPNDPRMSQYTQSGQQPIHPTQEDQTAPQYQTPQYQTPQYQTQPQKTYQGGQSAQLSSQHEQQQTPQQTPQQQTPSYQTPQSSSQGAGHSSSQYASSNYPSQADAARHPGTLAQSLSEAKAPHSYLNQQGSADTSEQDSLSRYSSSEYFPDSRGASSNTLEAQRAQMFGTTGTDTVGQPSAGSSYNFDSAPAGSQNSYDQGQPQYGRDQNSSLNAFQSRPDQDTDAPLGGFKQSDFGQYGGQDSAFASGEQSDASFYDGEYSDEEFEEDTGNRKNMLIIGVLVGALGLGGALAYAYKFGGIGGQFKTASAPPVISANDKPVKFKPKDAGGKNFASGNKMFYDRLRDGGQKNPSSPERMVSRQESVLNSSNTTGTLGQTAKKPGLSFGDTAKVKPSVAGNINSSAPRKVQTLTVLPNGRIIKAKPSTRVGTTAKTSAIPSIKSTTVTTVKPQVVAKGTATKSVSTALPTSKPVTLGSVPAAITTKVTPAPQQTAALATPQIAAPALAGTGFIVQVAARRNQSDALEAFANLQQKYPTILGAYGPLIQRADLGEKGIWYRLRVGPMNSKESASDVCKKLKVAGLKSCIVKSL